MKAVRVNQWGVPPQVEDVPRPTPADDEVLVRVRASSVNPVDGIIVAGYMKDYVSAPLTLGTDFAGEAVEVGKDVSHVRPGDAVYGMSPSYGTFAEYAAVKGAGVARKPQSLDDVQAGTVGLAALSTLQGLFNAAQLQPGERVVVHGAAGGVGAFAVQLAKDAGARVVASDRAGKAGFLRELGADEITDGNEQKLDEAIQGADVVFDLVGDIGERSLLALKRGARYVTPTFAEVDPAEADRRGIRSINTYTQPTAADLTRLAERIDAGKVKVFVNRSFPLDDIQAALGYKQTAGTYGKVGVTVE